MWMMTRYGMYSVVTNPDDPEFEVQMRARVRKDLEDLQKRFGPLLRPYQIYETPNADYAFRIFLPQHEFALLAFYLASDIDYGNFKAEIERTDPRRAAVYHRVWAILLEALQGINFDYDQVTQAVSRVASAVSQIAPAVSRKKKRRRRR